MARRKKKFSIFRLIRKSIVVVLILIGIALVTLLFLPSEKIASMAADRFEAATGRAMVLEGDVRPSIWPQLGVKTGRVSIANADWSDGGPMLEADSLAVGVDLASLISGDIRITNVEAIAPVILLEIAADGRANWDFSDAAPKSGTGGGATGTSVATGSDPVEAKTRKISLERADIQNGQVSFVDHQSGTRQAVGALNATVTLADFEGAAGLDATAVMNGQAVKLGMNISEFAGFLNDGAVPMVLAANVGGSKIDFDGRAGLQPLGGTGALSANLGDMAGLFGALGMARPDLPKGLGQTVNLSGDVTYKGDQLSLRAGTIQLDQNRLVGSVDLALGGKPRLNGNFSAGALDLTGLSGGGTTSKSTSGVAAPATPKASSGGGWSKSTIDVSALGLLDADVVIEADSVALGATNLGRTRMHTALVDRRAEVRIDELQAFDGAVDGMFVVNGRGGLSVRADMEGRSIAFKPLLSQLAGYDRLIAAGTMEFDVLGSGNSMDAIMRSLNGQGSFKIGDGELLGLDLVGMLRHLDASYVGKGAKTIFESVSGTFRIENGVIINDNLSLISPLLTAVGVGQVGLGEQTLNYRLTPKLLAGDGKNVQIPLLITGSWANPKFKLDLQSLADEKLEAEKNKLEEKAKAAVTKKIEEKTGIKLENSKSVEDALKKELEKKATDGLLKLLGK